MPILNTFKMAKNNPNQDEIIQQLLQTNPEMKTINEQINAANGNPEVAFYDAAKRKGCSKEETDKVLVQLKQIWNKL